MIATVLMHPKSAYLFARVRQIVHNLPQVLETPNNQRLNRYVKAVLSCPNCAASIPTGSLTYGRDGANGNAARMPDCMFRTPRPPYALRKADGGFQPNQGFDMPSIQTAATATPTPAAGTISTSNLTAVLGAFNACNLASSYIERGNFTAARRKIILALRDIDTLTTAAKEVTA